MGGQATAAVAAAEAVLQEATTAVAKQLQRAIPEAHNLFSEEDAGPAPAPHAHLLDQDASPQPSDNEDSHAEVCCISVSASPQGDMILAPSPPLQPEATSTP